MIPGVFPFRKVAISTLIFEPLYLDFMGENEVFRQLIWARDGSVSFEVHVIDRSGFPMSDVGVIGLEGLSLLFLLVDQFGQDPFMELSDPSSAGIWSQRRFANGRALTTVFSLLTAQRPL
jgi:hypothetical protein